MVNHVFGIMRDIRNERTELGVTENRSSAGFEVSGNLINLLVSVTNGWTESTKLSIKLEWSKDNKEYSEIGTFPLPDAIHGIVCVNFGDYVRYTIIVEGEKQELDVVLRF
ncbi:hypothetical protein [Exiguobacterium sp. s22]|uniref:hypothetical protein n=1 Tax=Exiguobacterium sp. s22 TaxID=2751272 RepID=UPI001BE81047|nr:hypothetical protein [Exiguobacterium sp. s22]